YQKPKVMCAKGGFRLFTPSCSTYRPTSVQPLFNLPFNFCPTLLKSWRFDRLPLTSAVSLYYVRVRKAVALECFGRTKLCAASAEQGVL
ncbi:hypothetical protein, partial [Gordonibacter sp.]|uniref:hypothetical protein n=1 Tax=Gordonibacter sp. TaxID=1968902 RepID=UPI002FCA3914